VNCPVWKIRSFAAIFPPSSCMAIASAFIASWKILVAAVLFFS
jgi:hypothetical protein